jgi:hypothetical protein
LTSSLTLSSIEFQSINIFFETDPIWQDKKDEIQKKLLSIFPSAQIFQHRLLSLAEWQVASVSYSDSDIVLLQNNDDHAFVEQVPGTLRECIEFMEISDSTPLCVLLLRMDAQLLLLSMRYVWLVRSDVEVDSVTA